MEIRFVPEMIASDHAATLIQNERECHDGVLDRACISRAGRHRGVGEIVLSADIIQFIRAPKGHCGQSDFPAIAGKPDGHGSCRRTALQACPA